MILWSLQSSEASTSQNSVDLNSRSGSWQDLRPAEKFCGASIGHKRHKQSQRDKGQSAKAKLLWYRSPNTILEVYQKPKTKMSHRNPNHNASRQGISHAMPCRAMLNARKPTIQMLKVSRSSIYFLSKPAPTTPSPTHPQLIPSFRYLRGRLVSLGPMSGLALRFPSGLPTPIIPIAGKSGPGLE